MWLSLVERCVRDAEVAGSNPVIPTNKKDAFGRLFCWSGYGERIPFCRFDSPGPDRTRREDPLMVLPSHNPPLCVEEGFYILGASSEKTAAWASFLLIGIRGAQPLHKFEKRCPDKSAGAFAGHPQNLCRAQLRAAGRPPEPAVKRTEGSLRRRCAPPGLRPAPAPCRSRPLRKPLTPALPEPTSGSGNPAGC